MKKLTWLIALTYLISNTSCIKYRTKYKCESNCTPITINLNVDNKSNLNLLANTKFEIVLMDNFQGSTENNRIMGKGISNGNGNFSTTVNCDTTLLNGKDYYIIINYEWDVNTIQVCFENATSFRLEDYPTGGIANLNIETYRKWSSTLDFIKKSNDSIKRAYVSIEKACNYYSSSSLNTNNNVVKHFDAKTILNNMNYVTITTVDLLNVTHEIKDSIFIDNNFAGKTFEY